MYVLTIVFIFILRLRFPTGTRICNIIYIHIYIGRFDDEQLFYLRARGIPEDQARRLVVRGFFNEIIAKIAVPAVRERLTEAIERELAITAGLN